MLGIDFYSKLDELNVPDSYKKLRELSAIFGVNISTLSKYKNEPRMKLQRFTARQLLFFGKMDIDLRTYIFNKRVNEPTLCSENIMSASDVIELKEKLMAHGMSQNGFFNLCGISWSSYEHIVKTGVVRKGLSYTFELLKAFDLNELFTLMLDYEVSERAITRLNLNQNSHLLNQTSI